jgi:3',5'-cyclic AMP phosphodiesterase CpdA
MKKPLLYLLLILAFPITVLSQTTTARRDANRYGYRPDLVRGPYLQVGTPNSMMVRWRTNELDVGFVRYGTNPDQLDKIAGNSSRTKEHIVTLSDLKPYTKYYYMIEGFKDTLQYDKNNHFTTLPKVGEKNKYRIGVFGDCGTSSTNQLNTRNQFEKYLGNDPLTAWILLGDNAYSFGTDAEYQANFFNTYKDNLLKKAPVFPAPGNHDYRDEPYAAEIAQRSGEIAYYQVFNMPTKGEAGGVPSHTPSFYSYDIGNIHFLSLDSQGSEDKGSRLFDTTGRQVKWVIEDLEKNKNKDWVVAYWHHPPYSMGSHNSDTETQMVKIRENFIKILERYGVDLVLCGHSHSYERSKLMQGHFGKQNTFSEDKHLLSKSSGAYNGTPNSSPYIKDASNKGTVYVLSGSAGRVDHHQTTFPHQAMPFSDVTVGGACMLEVEGNRLDLKWITSTGEIKDQFTMMKDVNKKVVINAKQGETVTLKASYIGNYKWSVTNKTTQSVEVKPGFGITKYTVNDAQGSLQDEFEVHVAKK